MSDTLTGSSNVNADDHVEQQLIEYLNLENPTSFFLFAGAGSGKTHSLVHALRHLKKTYGDTLRLRGRQVAVITYTNAACDEITRRTDYDSLFVVSTIHSFAWSQIQGFNKDIRTWLEENLRREISELQALELKGRTGSQASVARRASIESKEMRLERLSEIKSFVYNPNGDNRERNSLNHSEVVKIFTTLLLTKQLMQRMFVEKFPFLLIDESQDTHRSLIEALFNLQESHANRFCLGLIGDTMQRIYPDGKDKIEREIPSTWARPRKSLNHRSSVRIVRLINQIRSSADDHIQCARSDRPEGLVRLFVFAVESPSKSDLERRVLDYMAEVTGDSEWTDARQCKILILEHHMAAQRLGFTRLFQALHSVEEFRASFLDGSFAPTRLFVANVIPLIAAQLAGDKLAVAKIVRAQCPLLRKDNLRVSDEPMKEVRLAKEAIHGLLCLLDEQDVTCGAVVRYIVSTRLFDVPDVLKTALAAHSTVKSAESDDDSLDPLDKRIAALVNFLDCPFSEISAYAEYVVGGGPYDTHQGVKGLEFDRVVVLMDDEEAKGFMFGYDKLLGAKERSETDIKNEREGKETSIDRTRRLFYVTCSRARTSLALVAYSPDPHAVQAHVVSNGWFSADEVVLKF